MLLISLPFAPSYCVREKFQIERLSVNYFQWITDNELVLHQGKKNAPVTQSLRQN